ncbi:MAG: hypothetical protein GEV28_18395 [Actinophytocola sp.]|uniref:SPFH domain-containing protein n=1 Tax=Actinophytocola sp. TaxID=1872138 RepID=UPI00132773CE|nr:SPFH domain-containing protein [Actinophytocola sp.]MPZ82255.1 hypothetical protein [Actinophytocola sp.]
MTRTQVRRPAAVAALVVAVLTLAGCSIANTSPQNIAVHYANGWFDSRSFVDCSPTGQRSIDDVLDDHYFYPAGQRTFAFSSDKSADSGPLSVATSDSIELVARGTVTFHLNTSCEPYTDGSGKHWPGGRLQKFHEQIGSKLNAYSEDEDSDNGGDGWPRFVNTYIKDVVDRALDTNGLSYSWPDLYANNDIREEWETAVKKSIPDLVKAQLGDDLVLIDNVLLQKPEVPDALRDELTNNQAATLRAQTARTDQQAAETFPGGLTAYLAYQNALAVNEAIKSGKVQVIPVPQGSPVIVSPPSGR